MESAFKEKRTDTKSSIFRERLDEFGIDISSIRYVSSPSLSKDWIINKLKSDNLEDVIQGEEWTTYLDPQNPALTINHPSRAEMLKKDKVEVQGKLGPAKEKMFHSLGIPHIYYKWNTRTYNFDIIEVLDDRSLSEAAKTLFTDELKSAVNIPKLAVAYIYNGINRTKVDKDILKKEIELNSTASPKILLDSEFLKPIYLRSITFSKLSEGVVNTILQNIADEMGIPNVVLTIHSVGTVIGVPINTPSDRIKEILTKTKGEL